ncbi:histone H3.v1-like isoform X3 [Esox lucius]|uniref:histone H3.v1-like isoform X3 n=1 Tax=Esox lucius TaxID=8010 RepID=UPI001476E4AE|nr:histone H3.v1-like isoform X3 [Esox lucius]
MNWCAPRLTENFRHKVNPQIKRKISLSQLTDVMENQQKCWLEPIQEEEEEEAKELVEVVDEEEKDTNKKKENEEQEDRYCLKRAELDEEEDGPQLETEVMNKRGKETSNRWSRPCWPVSDEVLPTPQEPQQREGGGMLPPPQKKISSRGKRKLPTADGMFPKWLMNLMHNIEEATTHELIVE